MKITQILSETIEASQDLSALMQGIEHDLANRDREIDGLIDVGVVFRTRLYSSIV